MSLRCLLCFNKSMIRTSVSGNAHFGKRVSRMKLWSSQLRLLTSQSWEPVLELNYISDPQNYEAIESNINSRKGNGSIKVFMELLSKYNSSQQADKIESKKNILTKALKIPNTSNPRLHLYGDTPHLVETRV